MKLLIKIGIFFILSNCLSVGQDDGEINRQKIKIEIEKLAPWRRLSRHVKPVTNEQVDSFFEYIKVNRILEHYETDYTIADSKIKAAGNLHENIDDKVQKKKIIELFMNTLKEIQAVRDTLGINPDSETEGYLYVNPPLGPKDPNNMAGERTLSSPRFHEVLNRRTQSMKKIENLEQIHDHLYRLMTMEMKIPLEGISPILERSPAEKARTKDMLEKQAAAAGRKKPEPKAPVVNEK
jgi:hypothetical protein